jgi:uncharacterized membrane protein
MKEPEQIHKDQVFSNILVPVLITAILGFLAFVFLLTGTSTQTQTTAIWANISIIFMILQAAIFGLLLFFVFIVFSKLTTTWNKKLTLTLRRFRHKAENLNRAMSSAAQKTANPVILVKSFIAGIKKIFRK